ncbi:aminoglycoside phosphotransferase [Moraxella macacae 0408225]|uniref:Aminoglycoside phosphotransferase n=1 Tax=Moraxella macacae 0408225 TaxID=1230338 RepID=L2F604_9GAMM|nr:phosphotransferase [Moraxella macacae]ELA08489.1 aminoglycoside phosphotransferase [Moraxella macacae 0408225]
MNNTHTQRDAALYQWLQSVFDQPFSYQRLAGDASFRRYYRLQVDNHKTKQPFIVMDAPPNQESIKEFIAVDKLMADFIHVPKLIAVNEAQGFIVLEDLGTTDFADKLNENATNQEKLYQKALQTLINLQKISITNAKNLQHHPLPNYDESLLKREMSLFDAWFLPYIGIALDENTQQLWLNTQNQIVKDVASHPKVVVHRDFHSRNLIVTNELTYELGVIDFQDAVIGSYLYDLASLLRDAYINFDENWVETNLQYFYANTDYKNTLDFQQVKQDFNTISLQRHLKVIGIFIRLYQRDKKDRYLANLPKVMQDLLISLKNLINKNQVYADFYAWIEQTVLAKFQQKF